MTSETQPVEAIPTVAAESGWKARLKRWGPWPRRIAMAFALIYAWPIVMTLVYAVVPPPFSNVQLLRSLSGNGLDRQWVSLERISPFLVQAVIASEDSRFCEHSGVDWIEFNAVIGQAFDEEGTVSRGASTISMQTAKNLFLWEGRSFIRKGLELPLAYWMDFVWSKRRMIEIYLNIVEWAPGVYGAEAAARHHFKKPASKLTRREASLLAAVLPNPLKRNAGKPSKLVSLLASRIRSRMAIIGPYLTCL